MTPLDLARLSELAEKAYHGDWTMFLPVNDDGSTSPFVGTKSATVIADVVVGEATAAFIAAFDPTTAKALLSEIVALRGALRDTEQGRLALLNAIKTLFDGIFDLRSRLRTTPAERRRLAELRAEVRAYLRAATEPAEREAAR